jgi:hypothetical protein
VCQTASVQGNRAADPIGGTGSAVSGEDIPGHDQDIVAAKIDALGQGWGGNQYGQLPRSESLFHGCAEDWCQVAGMKPHSGPGTVEEQATAMALLCGLNGGIGPG